MVGVAHFVGRLWARRTRNRESATFEYDADWLASPARLALEPALMLAVARSIPSKAALCLVHLAIPHLIAGAVA